MYIKYLVVHRPFPTVPLAHIACPRSFLLGDQDYYVISLYLCTCSHIIFKFQNSVLGTFLLSKLLKDIISGTHVSA